MSPPSSTEYPFKWLPDGTAVDQPEQPLVAAKPRSTKKAPWLVGLEWFALIASALVIALLIKTFLFQAFYIPSESMTPTLAIGDRVIVNKLSYDLHSVRRGDIIVFTSPKGPDGKSVDPGINNLVKRVIGLPGETIEARDGRVYVNGKLLKEPYLKPSVRTIPGFAPFHVPKDTYWVMGDNRTDSQDSRFFPQHVIPKRLIVGRVFLRVWPLNRIAIL